MLSSKFNMDGNNTMRAWKRIYYIVLQGWPRRFLVETAERYCARVWKITPYRRFPGSFCPITQSPFLDISDD
ncbi:hypothetical protein MSHOH_2933 [Methanosarcina horonobensis HB-1 = JCM 15518]|uniref:Uncharacterized protein n=1 Tax=Methanosarcina horonobensis HB-1 = JCM 15518 TaxID=1434110 RepID=A0A0E3SEN0_9EURY|nr:hypothetical protein MSHOH_2933 [Methanosarcina horonobensis HB-1 = JCM 15518]